MKGENIVSFRAFCIFILFCVCVVYVHDHVGVCLRVYLYLYKHECGGQRSILGIKYPEN